MNFLILNYKKTIKAINQDRYEIIPNRLNLQP